jgi:hypothetical protein
MTQWGLDTLFNPAKRHMDEEKRRLQSTREEVGDSSGGKRIDLESGRVTIRKPDSEDVDESGEAEVAEPETKTKEKPREVKPKREATPAAKRAAERRARLRT